MRTSFRILLAALAAAAAAVGIPATGGGVRGAERGRPLGRAAKLDAVTGYGSTAGAHKRLRALRLRSSRATLEATVAAERRGTHRIVGATGQVEHAHAGDELSVRVGGGDAPVTYVLMGDAEAVELWGRANIARHGHLQVLPGPGSETPITIRVRAPGMCKVVLRRASRRVGELTVVAER